MGKRNNGEGNYWLSKKDNRWRFKIILPDGSMKQFSRKTKAEVKAEVKAWEDKGMLEEEITFNKLIDEGDEALTDEVFIGWGNIQDEEGAEIPFNEENKKALLDKTKTIIITKKQIDWFISKTNRKD